MANAADAFRRFLDRIPPQVIKAVRPVIEREAQGIVSSMRSRVPRDSGTLSGTIRYEMQTTRAIIRAGSRATDTSSGGILSNFVAGFRAGAKGGSAPKSNNALHQEFGTARMRARPFFYPAWNARRRASERAIKAAIKNAVEQAR